MALTINQEGMSKLGTKVKGLFDDYANDRKGLEKQWIKNLRQYQGKYDEDILSNIPAERSHSYPKDTRVKVKGFVAKLMEMMFPSQEENWELEVDPVPSIPKSALAFIIQSLEQEEAVKAEAEGRPPVPITSEDIERRVVAFAKERKDNMEAEIADQLADEDTDYPNMCKRVLRSGGIYGVGVARSPMVRRSKERVWEINEKTGQYEAKTKTLRRPYPVNVRIWDIFPDLSAHTWKDQDRIFERMVMIRGDVRDLATRDDFIKENIEQYLRDHQTGNFTQRDFETELRSLAHTSNMTNQKARRYEVYRHLGFLSAHDLVAAGVEVAEEDMADDILADIWAIDDTIIKAEIAVFGDRPADQYPAFIAAEDEDAGMTGVGLPEDLRDSQMGVCAGTRAMMDNMAAVAGPIFEVNIDLLPPRRKEIGTIRSFMTIEREGDGPLAASPAIRQINTESHIAEIQAVVKMQREQLDIESNLPAWTFGATQDLGDAFRTSNNMSMMVGGANMISKDTVRAFDQFTTQLIGGMLKWNMEFNEREDIKGSFGVRAKGNLSLVAKEVRGAALDQFMATLTPEERAMLDTYGIMLDRLKARDLPTDRLYQREDAEALVREMKATAAAQAKVESDLTVAKTGKENATAGKTAVETQNMAESAEVVRAEILARLNESIARAKDIQDRTQLENMKTLLTVAEETPTS